MKNGGAGDDGTNDTTGMTEKEIEINQTISSRARKHVEKLQIKNLIDD